MAEIVVVGSINMDLVAVVPRLPKPGETITGSEFRKVPGGKGANQAFAAAKLGGRVAMIGRVGRDPFGAESIASLRYVGVDTGWVRRDPAVPTGVALITVGANADNCIAVVPGANAELAEADLAAVATVLAEAKVLMVQLEIPLPVVLAAMRMAKAHGVRVLLDPAPAVVLPREVLAMADYIAPNQTESEILTGVRVQDRDTAVMAGRILLEQGVGVALVKLGSQGVVVVDPEGSKEIDGHHVKALDTTAAGDCFAAGFAVAVTRGVGVYEAARYGNAAAAVSVTRFGAQSSMPTAAEVEALLNI